LVWAACGGINKLLGNSSASGPCSASTPQAPAAAERWLELFAPKARSAPIAAAAGGTPTMASQNAPQSEATKATFAFRGKAAGAAARSVALERRAAAVAAASPVALGAKLAPTPASEWWEKQRSDEVGQVRARRSVPCTASFV
jgi:hypothetical protein